MSTQNLNTSIDLLLKKGRIALLMLICTVFSNFKTNASTGNAVINSNWNNTMTWSFNGVNRLPSCADTLVVPATKTVTVSSQHDYTACISPMIIYVYGILQFNNGNKLDLPCGSVVFIMSGGTVKKSTAGGGSSTLISICGTVEWKAGDGPLSGIDTLGTVVTLPIDLISFEAKKMKRSVKLNWSTATEINNSYFTIERSTNGTEFYEIAKVNGSGNSTFIRSYSYDDNSPASGVSYYRLRQTDFDGKTEVFSPVAVNFKKEDSNNIDVVVLKNPFNNYLKIAVDTYLKGKIEIRLFDVQGNTAYSSSELMSENATVLTNDLPDLKPGIYFLQVTVENVSSKMVQVVRN